MFSQSKSKSLLYFSRGLIISFLADTDQSTDPQLQFSHLVDSHLLSDLVMTEEERNLLNALLTEYLPRVAPSTAQTFQARHSTPGTVASIRLEDVVEHFSKTAPSTGDQLGLKDDLASSNRGRKLKRTSSGEENLLKVDISL